MRILALPALALVLLANTSPNDAPALNVVPLAEAISVPLYEPNPETIARIAQAYDAFCRDRISQARGAAGLGPLLKREPASPDRPYLIYAVDRRQDGCSVMVMKGNPDDIRPLPGPSDDPIMLIPADDGE